MKLSANNDELLPIFERLISLFVELITKKIYSLLVTEVSEKIQMSIICFEKQLYSNFHYTRYATDVTFQQENESSGNNEEGKIIMAENVNYTFTKWRYQSCSLHLKLLQLIISQAR